MIEQLMYRPGWISVGYAPEIRRATVFATGVFALHLVRASMIRESMIVMAAI
jgi:hypothetical protein